MIEPGTIWGYKCQVCLKWTLLPSVGGEPLHINKISVGHQKLDSSEGP